jgi:hypothetical protein
MPIEIGKTAPEARVPGPPPRFSGLIAALGILAACGALTALVIGLRRQRSRRTLTEFGTALILICLVALGATRISQTANADVRNPIPRSQASVAAGAKTYQALASSIMEPTLAVTGRRFKHSIHHRRISRHRTSMLTRMAIWPAGSRMAIPDGNARILGSVE